MILFVGYKVFSSYTIYHFTSYFILYKKRCLAFMKTKNYQEITYLLYLYPIAKTRFAEIKEVINFSKYATTCNKTHMDNLQFYQFLIKQVDLWLNHLYSDEKRIIELYYFQNLSSERTALLLNYSDHSSVLKKCNHIIKKIEKNFF